MIETLIAWVNTNKEWFFSGVGVAVISVVIAIIRTIYHRKNNVDKNVNAIGKNNIIVSDSAGASISVNNYNKKSYVKGKGNDCKFDKSVIKVKAFAEIESESLFQQKIVTSLHLLFSMLEANVAYNNRREMRETLKVGVMRQYINELTESDHGYSKKTTKGYERIFEQAISMKEKDEFCISLQSLFTAISVVRSNSITKYFNSIDLTWTEFSALIQPTLCRGKIDSP